MSEGKRMFVYGLAYGCGWSIGARVIVPCVSSLIHKVKRPKRKSKYGTYSIGY